nr:immunoglobulin heavy chain junction region [Mus musculus]MBK4198557.1 immunoglobulin heavy chain junction region [Mus musculus]
CARQGTGGTMDYW